MRCMKQEDKSFSFFRFFRFFRSSPLILERVVLNSGSAILFRSVWFLALEPYLYSLCAVIILAESRPLQENDHYVCKTSINKPHECQTSVGNGH
mmetsp:Transcript_17769/g.23259  ORF Transcript_17769/g.23259 Transcript_17769/m.23259 type:complete len:94 (-) Transcript_17769:918-1199(-)